MCAVSFFFLFFLFFLFLFLFFFFFLEPCVIGLFPNSERDAKTEEEHFVELIHT